MYKRLGQAGLATFFLFLAGCIQRAEKDGDVVYRYEFWAPLLIVLGGIGFIALGILIFRKKPKILALILPIIGLFMLVAIGPSMFMDKVLVSKSNFYSEHGMPWDRVKHDVKFAEVRTVDILEEVKTGRRGRKSYSYTFIFRMKTGKEERVPIGDLVKEAIKDIAQRFGENNIPVNLPPQIN